MNVRTSTEAAAGPTGGGSVGASEGCGEDRAASSCDGGRDLGQARCAAQLCPPPHRLKRRRWGEVGRRGESGSTTSTLLFIHRVTLL